MKALQVTCPVCRGKGTVIGIDKLGTYRQIGCPTCNGGRKVRLGIMLDFLAWVIVGTRGDKE